MATRHSYAFTISSEHRSQFGGLLEPGWSVVATLTQPPRAQLTPEERTYLQDGSLRYQWGLGIGLNECNLLYAMHRTRQADFALAFLAIQVKTNIGQSTHAECHGNNYTPTAAHSPDVPDLGVIVIKRTSDGQTLCVQAFNINGTGELTYPPFSMPLPDHWNGDCNIFLRGDNCLASGVITIGRIVAPDCPPRP